jgi:ASC-1-like (ASCH) protein
MAKTKAGKKIVEVRSHYRKLKGGKRIKVREFRRSTPE